MFSNARLHRKLGRKGTGGSRLFVLRGRPPSAVLTVVVTSSALGLLTSASPAASGAPCFWGSHSDPDVVNAAYPDKAAGYWAGLAALPSGGELIFKGRYPHGRYFSFNLYNSQGAPVAGLADVNINPDHGSGNPFRAGARRGAAVRNYTVFMKPGPAPAKPGVNTLYLPSAGRTGGSLVLYRLYLPDGGRDATGGVGLPDVTLVNSDGSKIDETKDCTRASEDSSLLQPAFSPSQTYGQGSLPAPQVATSGRNPLLWQKFFNTQHAVVSTATEGTSLQPPVDQTLASGGRGGFLSNIDTAYITALGNRSYGPLLVIRGKAPTAPRTVAGQRRMGSGQVRYWSMCTNEPRSSRYVDCLYDEQAVLDRRGYYTIVISQSQDRPRNATPRCRVNWLAWGASTETLPILRNTLPARSFRHAIQLVTKPDELAKVTGSYLPIGTYTTRSRFEARGCPAAGA